MKTKILFLCTGNSCRSQMAEGWANHLKGNQIEAASAGIETHGLNPLAVRVMAEAGVDISDHCSKTTEELEDNFDYVITVCGHADEQCPVFPAATCVIHHGFDDPPKLAADCESTEEALIHYRRVRDEIRDFVKKLPEKGTEIMEYLTSAQYVDNNEMNKILQDSELIKNLRNGQQELQLGEYSLV